MIRFLQILVFLAAFLLFQIELISAKVLLPFYGGSYLVWGSAVVFFQAVLLLGYLAIHLANRYFGTRGMIIFHLIVLGGGLLVMPGQLQPSVPLGDFFLALSVFCQLARAIGPVFFALTIAIDWFRGLSC